MMRSFLVGATGVAATLFAPLASAQDAAPTPKVVSRMTSAPPTLTVVVPPAQRDAVPLYPRGAPPMEGAAPKESWNGILGNIMVRNVTVPTITPFLPPPGKSTGAAVIIAPGGAFVSLAMDIEGWDAARWFASHGVAAFVLKYRLRPSPDDLADFKVWQGKQQVQMKPDGEARAITFQPALDDGIEAVRFVRAHAGKYGISPNRIGMIGFSAGAFNTLNAALSDSPGAKLDFIGLIYGPTGSVPLTKTPPPLFAALAANDPLFGNSNYGIVKSWRQAGSQAELHVYQTGDHGFGMLKNGTTTELWPEEFLAWMKMNGILKN